MLDAVDRVVRLHLQKLLLVKGKPIPMFSTATADQDDQPFTQAGTGKKADKIEFPFASLVRLPTFDITDDAMTKRVHNYTGYNEENNARLGHYVVTLHYNVTIFAETRKISEDLATSLYARLRNNNQISIAIHLPLTQEKETDPKEFVAQSDSDIILTSSVTQVNQQRSDTAQMYKCQILFDVQNVNIYDIFENKEYVYNIFVQDKLEASERSEKRKIMSVKLE